MSCMCDLTAVAVQFGNNVSHSQRKTRRRFNPNIRAVTYHSYITGVNYRLRVSARAMRTVEKVGGFDAFITKANPSKMSDKVKTIRRLILKKIEGAAA